METVEAHVAAEVARESYDPKMIDGMSELVSGAVDDLLAADREAKAQMRKQLDTLEAQEERLIDLAASGAIDVPKVRERIEKTTLQKAALKEKLAQASDRLKYGAEQALAYLDLLRIPGELYQRAPVAARRDLLTAFFEKLYIHVEGDAIRVKSVRSSANGAIREFMEQLEASADERAEKTRTPRVPTGSSSIASSSSLISGLRKNAMAGVPGLEPRTTEPESAVLPITPYPKGVPACRRHKGLLYARQAGTPNRNGIRGVSRYSPAG